MSPLNFHTRQVAIAGYSNSGKTTLIEKLFPFFNEKNYAVGYLKHDAHQFKLDQEGKDSYRIWEAGAQSLLAHNSQESFLRKRQMASTSFAFEDCDFLIVEGHKRAPFPKLLMLDEQGQLWHDLDEKDKSSVIALIGPNASCPIPNLALPYFQRDQVSAIGIYILSQFLYLHQVPVLHGLVMTGGKSERMGEDKSQLVYSDQPQYQIAHDLLKQICHTTYISCRSDQDYAPLPTLKDIFHDIGPLGGLLTAFQKDPNSAFFSVACDLPFLETRTLKHLIKKRNPLRHATVYVHEKDQQMEPLCTIYEPSIRPHLITALMSQNYSLKKLLENIRIEKVLCLDPETLDNINTQEQKKIAQLKLSHS